MNIQQISEEFFITGQVLPEHMETIVNNGFRSIICNRPDGEETGQPNFQKVSDAARAAGLEMRYVPIVHGAAVQSDFADFSEALTALPKPVLGYCRSGMRAANMYGAVTEKTN